MKINNKIKTCVIGLGYVGLPLATSLAKYYFTIAYDQKKKKN